MLHLNHTEELSLAYHPNAFLQNPQRSNLLVCKVSLPSSLFLKSNNQFGATKETGWHLTIDGVVDAPYTTETLSRKGGSFGFRAKERQELLPGAQRAPGRKNSTITPGAAWRKAANYGRHSPPGITQSPFPRSGLVEPARAGERPHRAIRHTITVCAEPYAFVTQPKPGPGRPVASASEAGRSSHYEPGTGHATGVAPFG